MGDNSIQSGIGHIKPVMPNSILKPENIDPFRDKNDGTFSTVLKDSIQSINALEKNAQAQVEKLSKGEVQNVHQVMIAMQEANITFKLMMKVRNQILAAYNEISKST